MSIRRYAVVSSFNLVVVDRVENIKKQKRMEKVVADR